MGSVALNAKPSRWENDVPQPTETLPDRIVSTAYLFRQSKVLFVAAELDVFGILAVGPLDLETLKARSGVHPRGARDFFDALVALGLLDRDSKGRYANTPESDCYLVRGKPTYIGGLLRHLDKRHYENWDRLCRALITRVSERARHQGLFGVLCRREDAADFSRRHVGEQPDCGAFTGGAISMVALSNLHRHRDGTGLRAGRDCARPPAFARRWI